MTGHDRSVRIPLETMLADVAAGVEPDQSRALLFFETAGVFFAIDATRVERIVARPFVAPLPVPFDHVFGVASVQGRMRLVSDPSGSGYSGGTRLIVIHGDAQLALVADRITGVRRVDPAVITPVSNDTCVFGHAPSGEETALLIDPERMIAE